ncbi:UBX domain-containing protein 4 [Sparganum proliferum]
MDGSTASTTPMLSFRGSKALMPFSTEDETKTLEELELWPSAVLLLVSPSNAGHNTVSPYAHDSVVGYTQDALYQLLASLGSGLRTGVDFAVSVGNGVFSVCRTLFTSVFGGGRTQTTGRSHSPASSNSSGQSSPSRPYETETTAFRRHGNVSRLSHMPDETDEQARWNGNSTTQM